MTRNQCHRRKSARLDFRSEIQARSQWQSRIAHAARRAEEDKTRVSLPATNTFPPSLAKNSKWPFSEVVIEIDLPRSFVSAMVMRALESGSPGNRIQPTVSRNSKRLAPLKHFHAPLDFDSVQQLQQTWLEKR